jgi:hypothetical protein
MSPRVKKVQTRKPDDSHLDPGVSGEQAPPLNPDGTLPPTTDPSLFAPADTAVSMGSGTKSTIPADAAVNEPKMPDDSTANAGLSGPASQVQGAADNRLPHRTPAKPVSPQKLKSNRENSKHSTGPKTESGKQRSSQNSYKHGFFARRLFPSRQQWSEDGADYKAAAIAVHEHYLPVGHWEMFWAEKIATEALRHARSVGYQQSVLGSVYRFSGTQLNTAQRHETAGFKHMLQAIKMLESIQEARRAHSIPVQPIASDPKQESDAPKGPATVTPEPSETDAGCAGETELPADSSGSEDTVDAGRTDDEQADYEFLYQGPLNQGTVSSDGQGPENDGTRQSTMVHGTNPDASQSQPAEGAVREAANVPQTLLADYVRHWMEDQGMLPPEPLLSVAQTENAGTKPNSAPAEEPTQRDIKEDSGE